MTEARFIVIAISVAALHIIASVVLFTVTLAGIGAMTAGAAQNTTSAWACFEFLNFGPIAIDQYLKGHVFTPPPKNMGEPGWTQEQQIELGQNIDNRNGIKYALFFLWPFLVGASVASGDLFLRRNRRKRDH